MYNNNPNRRSSNPGDKHLDGPDMKHSNHISTGYDEGLCRECREPAFGLAYDVEGLCDVCGDGHEWGDK